MRFWKTLIKRSALALVAVAVALTWTRTGRAATPCTIERGQDPLDVLNSGVRHNVWIVLDSSGSMNDPVPATMPVQTKMQVAKATLTEIIDEFKDASGKPLVNWGFVRFGSNSAPSTSTRCSAMFLKPSTSALGSAPNGCIGLNLAGLINPPACSAPSNTAAVKAAINAAPTTGMTPNGISMDQISERIVSGGYVAGLLPNQKNFVILVSDGDDTCECDSTTLDIPGKLVNGIWTQTPVGPFVGANDIPPQLRGGTANANYTISITNGNDVMAANAGTKGRLLYERLNDTVAARTTGAKGGAFVIGLGLSGPSPSRAHHMAWEASGAFYGNPNAYRALLANNKVQLKNALRDAFARIGVPASTVTLGSPIVGSVREVISSWTNPDVSPDEHHGEVGPGPVDEDDIREARKVRADHMENVVFTTSVDIPNFKGHFTASTTYRVTDPHHPRTARQGMTLPIWDAGERLQLRDPATRNILMNKKGTTLLVPFNNLNVSAADLGVGVGFLSNVDGVGALTANDARDMVIGVVRGYRLSKHTLTGTLYAPGGIINFSTEDALGQPTWKLYEATGAPAVVVGPARSPDFDPPQNHADAWGVGGTQVGDGFYWDHFNRRTMVYLPTNGGMMHAFDGETGDEAFAYIPDDAIGYAAGEVPASRDTLADFVDLVVSENNGIQNHQFFLSGPPTVREAFLRSDVGGDDRWHTILTFGRARGGRYVSALDITDPAAPKLRFNVGNREGLGDSLLDGLGETWSTPVMGNVATVNPTSNPNRVDQWLAFLGGGYGCNNAAKEGQYLFALRLENGSVYYRGAVTSDGTSAIPYNAVVAMPTLYNPHLSDVADNKDFVTRAYVGDVQGNVWKLNTLNLNPTAWTLNKFASVGKKQPITAALALMKDATNEQVYVMGGTGGDLRVSAAGNPFKFFTLIDRDSEGANTTQYPLGSSPFWSRTLLPEERVYVNPVRIGDLGSSSVATPLIFFAASAPGFNGATCTGFFTSSLYALAILTGTAAVDLDGMGGNEASVSLGQDKISGIYETNEQLYVSKSGGLGGSSSLLTFGDGDFSDDGDSGGGLYAVQVLIDGFRVAPF